MLRRSTHFALSTLLCLAALLLCYGCQHPALSQDRAPAPEITAERCQLTERLQWQWVPPQCLTIQGAQVCIPGHWHNRFAPCAICGDRTQRPGSVAQANPQLASLPQPANPAPTAPVAHTAPAPTMPAAPPAQAAGQTRDEERLARLAAELAGLRIQGAKWEACDGRIQQLESLAAQQGEQLAALRRDVGLLGQGVQDLDAAQLELRAAVERLGAGVTGVESATAADRARLRERVTEIVGPLVASAAAEWGLSQAAALAVEGFAVGGPAGLGVAAAGWLVARALRRGRLIHVSSGVTDATETNAGGREAPAEPSFRDGESHTVVIENPPPPQVTVTEQTFVPYATDRFSQAHAWACEKMAQKYPGSTAMLETLKSLIEQKLRA